MSRRLRIGLIAGAVGVVGLALATTYRQGPGQAGPPVQVALTSAVGLAFLVAGITAWTRWPATRLGLLFTLVGYLWMVPVGERRDDFVKRNSAHGAMLAYWSWAPLWVSHLPGEGTERKNREDAAFEKGASAAACEYLPVSFRALLLDVGGVFLVPKADLVAEALATVNVKTGIPDFVRAHFRGIEAGDCGGGGEGFAARYLNGYMDELDIAASDRGRSFDALLRLWEDPTVDLWRQELPDSIRGLTLLAANDFPLGIVSNSDGTVEERLRSHGICQVGAGPGVQVIAIIDSSVVGVAKPDPTTFAPAIAALGLPANEVAYVGDSVHFDVLGAERAGLRPVHFDPYRACRSQHHHQHIQALTELVP